MSCLTTPRSSWAATPVPSDVAGREAISNESDDYDPATIHESDRECVILSLRHDLAAAKYDLNALQDYCDEMVARAGASAARYHRQLQEEETAKTAIEN